MQKNVGLGRGLSSLIPNKKVRVDFTDTGEEKSQVVLIDKERIVELPVEKISPNPNQPRRDFDENGLNELAESIKEHGIIQPLIVAPDGENNWQIIAGERRWRAAKKIGLKTVPAIIRDFDEQKKLEIALIENIQRKNLNALETAQAYQMLMDQFNLDYAELGRKVGKNRTTISNTLRILTNTVDEVKNAIRSGKITEGHARVLAGLPQTDQLTLLEKMTAEKWNVREAEKAGREVVVKKHIRNLPFDPETRAKEDELQKFLSTKVEIKKSGAIGQIIVKFFSEEELAEIVRKILN